MSPYLSQYKLYLKILGISYYIADIIEIVLQMTHIFNINSNDSYIWFRWSLNNMRTGSKNNIIWYSQSKFNTKNLINRCFNISSHITMIRDINMNLGIFQYKNYWKWDHTTFACYTHYSKCIKCNNPYEVEHHREMAWYCNVNFEINPLRLKIKRKPCSYSFKCINYKGYY